MSARTPGPAHENQARFVAVIARSIYPTSGDKLPQGAAKTEKYACLSDPDENLGAFSGRIERTVMGLRYAAKMAPDKKGNKL